MNGSLLQELVAFAASSDDITPPNFGPTKLLWQLTIGVDGVPQPELTPLTSTEMTKTGQTRVVRGIYLDTPKIGRTSGIRPMLGPDGLDYVFGWGTTDGEKTKNAARHEAYLALHQAWAESADPVGDPLPRAYVSFLTEHLEDVRQPEEWAPKDGVLVTVDGAHLHESPTAESFWATRAGDAKASGTAGLCLVCGIQGELVRTFPQLVRGSLVPGGQSSGVAPVSINAEPFGYDLKKDLRHVPVCAGCAYAVPAALNALLADDRHTTRAARTVTTWWVSDGTPVEDELAAVKTVEPATVAKLLRAASTGRIDEGTVDLSHFNSLTLSGNASRLVVRRWYRVSIEEIRANLAAWFADTRVTSRFDGDKEFHPLIMLAAATGRHDGRFYLRPGAPGGRHPDDIVERLYACAYERAPVPPQIVAHLLQRIAADRRVDERRAALLRLGLIRSPHVKETIMPGLDPENTNPCYVAGRLFATYDDLQWQASDGTLNATFADKNLAGAISSPRLALASGEKQSTAWLGKLRRTRTGAAVNIQRSIDDIVGLLSPNDPIPARASLEEQAMFVMGYHHQRAATHRARAERAASKAADRADTPSISEA